MHERIVGIMTAQRITNLSHAFSSWLPFLPCGPSQSYKRAIGEVSERGCYGSPLLFPDRIPTGVLCTTST
jgi:hypothetical protein